MGEHAVPERSSEADLRLVTRALLDDLAALATMLDEGRIEADARRIGAEQEMVLIDESGSPVPRGPEILHRIKDDRFTTELGRFDIEANLAPREFSLGCLAGMERELHDVHAIAARAAAEDGAKVLLVGILPTLAPAHLGLDWMSPVPRYHELNRVLTQLSGGRFWARIKGTDELRHQHDNMMLEACNTSFQVHFQVAPADFARLYNVAQLVTAPVLAVAANSPVLLRHRLWHETRIPLFEQSIDARSEAGQARGKRGRVSFGTGWVRDSILEILREDVSSFRVLLGGDAGEASTDLLDRGVLPPLRSLMLFVGTVYRWNRPCYGVRDGVAHLRIENRALPAGPSIADEVASAAFYFGLLAAVHGEHGDVSRLIDFEVARDNFYAAARSGLQARLTWIGGKVVAADALILKRLLPLAREGLRAHRIDGGDVDRYLGIVEERVRHRRTGASWMLDSLAAFGDRGRPEERHRALTVAMARRQAGGEPVHAWALADLDEVTDRRQSFRRVGQVMTREFRTVHPEDVVDLAASLMDWERLRWLPVEDDEGRLVGLVTHATMLRLLAQGRCRTGRPLAVREVMRPDPITATPDTPTLEAIEAMRRSGVGCLPVVEGDRLVGLVTEHDFMDISARLLQSTLGEAEAGAL